MLDLRELWKNWAGRYWWLRGVTTALALTALVPTFVDLSRYEFLLAFHAVVLGWDVFTSNIGQIIGQIPYIPDFSGEVVNTVIFAVSIGFPSFYAEVNPTFLPFRNKSNFLIYFNIFMSIISFVTLIYLYYLIISDGLILFYGFSARVTTISYIMFALLLTVMIIWTLIHLPKFRRGVLFVVTFIVVMEILYILETPWLAEEIKDFSCEVLELGPENCVRKG